ncbi:hypothetical protein NQZ68_040524 [Dissostichus eleginoides]|nr:hypothetical protein NQZ68_040524 [Dissostichus eleginoides]
MVGCLATSESRWSCSGAIRPWCCLTSEAQQRTCQACDDLPGQGWTEGMVGGGSLNKPLVRRPDMVKNEGLTQSELGQGKELAAGPEPAAMLKMKTNVWTRGQTEHQIHTLKISQH